MRPKVSVIILVYQVENYIERCACSLFEQTLKDIEYIFVDDCTKDNSMSVLANVLDQYPDRKNAVKIIHNEVNLGQAESRLKGIKLATGEYVIHCDSDDWIATDMYEKLYNKALNNHSDIVWCDFYKVNKSSTQIEKQTGIEKSSDAVKDILRGKRMGPLWNHLVKHDIITQYTYLPPKANLIEDVVLLIQYYIHSNKISYLPEPLYFYYHSPKSVTFVGEQEKMMWQAEEMAKNLVVIEQFLQENGLSDEYKHYIEYRKYFNKRWLLPVIKTVDDCKIWTNLHNDVNYILYLNPLLTIKDKISCLLVETRLYPVLKRILK